MTAASRSINKQVDRKGRNFQRKFWLDAGMLLIIPYLVWMLVFGLGPGLSALVFSFSKFDKGTPILFAAGLENFIGAFTDFRFLPALQHTMTFAAMAVPIGLITGLFLALLLHLVRDKAAIGLRTVFFIPGALTGPVLVIIFAVAFDPKISPYGLFMKPFGWTQAADIIKPSTVTFLFVLLRLFWTVGGNIAIFYGALEGITPEVIEAAMIDGCDGIRMARFIKLPMLQAWVINYIINSLVFNMQIYTEPALLNAAMEGLAPVNAYWSLNQLGAQLLLYSGNFGLAAPISLLQVSIGFIAAYLLVTKTGFYQTEAVQ
ncbi:MAG: sugar ABC transporter permease [Anaerolineae bacterium]|nr:sugar ABC transporter permease [Anaerolineae bacterium]